MDRDGRRLTRIVHLVPAAFGGDGVTGGAERYVWELARAMAERVPTRLVTFGPRTGKFRAGELDVRVVGRPWAVRGNALNPFSIRLLSHLGDASVIHCHQTHVLASSFAAAFARATGKRVVTTDLGGGGWDISGYLSTRRWYHRHLHISEYSRTVYGMASDPRAGVIWGGVDARTFHPSDEAPPSDAPILFVGRMLPHKGVDTLIDAVDSDWPLELVGKPYSPRYLVDLRRKAIGKTVTFRHDADDAALVRSYRRASVVVLPSVYRTCYGDTTDVPELLGQTLLEAMACGKPCIATRVASLPEVVADGETGFLVPPNDPAALREKLDWLRNHPADAVRMGEAGRRRVLDHFTWPATVERCLAAYATAGR